MARIFTLRYGLARIGTQEPVRVLEMHDKGLLEIAIYITHTLTRGSFVASVLTV